MASMCEYHEPTIRTQLEQSLPAFHEIRLFQGEREIKGKTVIEMELQAVATFSPSKALTELESFRTWNRMEPDEEVLRGILAAVEVLLVTFLV